MKLERTIKMSHSGITEEINLEDKAVGPEIKEKINQARENKEEEYLVEDSPYIYKIRWNDKRETVSISFFAAIAGFEPSGDKRLSDFE